MEGAITGREFHPPAVPRQGDSLQDTFAIAAGDTGDETTSRW
jgi:hypothetical protein